MFAYVVLTFIHSHRILSAIYIGNTNVNEVCTSSVVVCVSEAELANLCHASNFSGTGDI